MLFEVRRFDARTGGRGARAVGGDRGRARSRVGAAARGRAAVAGLRRARASGTGGQGLAGQASGGVSGLGAPAVIATRRSTWQPRRVPRWARPAGSWRPHRSSTPPPWPKPALRAGRLSGAQAASVIDAAAANPGAEARLVDGVGRMSLTECRDECARVKAAADPDPDATYRRIHAAPAPAHLPRRRRGLEPDARGAPPTPGRAFNVALEPIIEEYFRAAPGQQATTSPGRPMPSTRWSSSPAGCTTARRRTTTSTRRPPPPLPGAVAPRRGGAATRGTRGRGALRDHRRGPGAGACGTRAVGRRGAQAGASPTASTWPT